MKKLLIILAVVLLSGCDLNKSQTETEGEISPNITQEVIEEVIEDAFSVLGDIPEMQSIPPKSEGIHEELYTALLYQSSLDLRLLHIYDDFEEKIEFRPHEYVKINPEEYVISLLVFHPRERDPYPNVGLREGFLLKFFVSVQKEAEGWMIKNIEIVNSGFPGKGDRFTKYAEKETQKVKEKIAPLRKVTLEDLSEQLNYLSRHREDSKATFLDSLKQRRPSYLHAIEKEDFDFPIFNPDVEKKGACEAFLNHDKISSSKEGATLNLQQGKYTRLEAMELLANAWLCHFILKDETDRVSLLDFSLRTLELTPSDICYGAFPSKVYFDVLPSETSKGYWAAGNGKFNGDWKINKNLFTELSEENKIWHLKIGGTGGAKPCLDSSEYRDSGDRESLDLIKK